MDNQQERRLIDMGWLAAAWEGEGCFCLSHDKRTKTHSIIYPKCDLVNSDQVFINNAARILKEGNIPFYMRTTYTPKTSVKSLKGIRIAGIKRVVKFIDFIYPYLVTKRDMAKLMKEFAMRRISKNLSPYTDEDWSYYRRMKALNSNKTLSSETNTPSTANYVVKIESDLTGDSKSGSCEASAVYV